MNEIGWIELVGSAVRIIFVVVILSKVLLQLWAYFSINGTLKREGRNEPITFKKQYQPIKLQRRLARKVT